MDTFRSQTESSVSQGALIERVTSDAKRAFSAEDEAFLEACAEQVVDEICGDSIRVTAFVPVLAMRRIRDIVGNRELVGSVAGGIR